MNHPFSFSYSTPVTTSGNFNTPFLVILPLPSITANPPAFENNIMPSSVFRNPIISSNEFIFDIFFHSGISALQISFDSSFILYIPLFIVEKQIEFSTFDNAVGSESSICDQILDDGCRAESNLLLLNSAFVSPSLQASFMSNAAILACLKSLSTHTPIHFSFTIVLDVINAGNGLLTSPSRLRWSSTFSN